MLRRAMPALVISWMLVTSVYAQNPAQQPASGEGAAEKYSIVKVFSLKYANAQDVQRILLDLFHSDTRDVRFHQSAGPRPAPQALRTTYDLRTNTLIVLGTEENIDIIGHLVEVLDVPVPDRFEKERGGGSVEEGETKRGTTRPDHDPAGAKPSSQTRSDAEASGTPLAVRVRTPKNSSLKIKSVVSHGQPVRKGDVVLTIDSSRIRDAIDAQKVVVAQAKAALRQAEANLERLRSQQEGKLVEVEQKKNQARLALAEFQEGTRPLQIQVYEEEIRQAERALEDQRRREGTDSSDPQAVKQHQGVLDVARRRLEVFNQFTVPKQIAELEEAVASADREAQRIRTQTEFELKAAEGEVAARRTQVEVAAEEFAALEKDLENCTITAPHDGVVARATPTTLREAAEVRNGQIVFRVRPLEDFAPQKDEPRQR